MKLKGNTPEDKLKHVERILTHMKGRLQKKVVAIMPPQLIQAQGTTVDASGLMHSFMVPSGRLTKLLIVIDEYLKKDVSILVELVDTDKYHKLTFPVSKRVEVFDLDLTTYQGDVIEISVVDPLSIKGYWLTALFEFPFNQLKVEKVLIEALNEGV